MAAVNPALTGGPGTDALTKRDTFAGTLTGRYKTETIDQLLVAKWRVDGKMLSLSQRHEVVNKLLRDVKDGYKGGAPNLSTVAAVADALSELGA